MILPRLALAGFTLAMAAMAAPSPAPAHEGRIVKAELRAQGGGRYTLAATIRHGDTGWSHYINGFTVESPDGTLLSRRVLYHPHVDEQPFTRSSDRFRVPAGIAAVVVRMTHLQSAGAKAAKTITVQSHTLRIAIPARR